MPHQLCGFNMSFMFTPILGEMIQFDEHIFQMGWFNHQPAHICKRFLLFGIQNFAFRTRIPTAPGRRANLRLYFDRVTWYPMMGGWLEMPRNYCSLRIMVWTLQNKGGSLCFFFAGFGIVSLQITSGLRSSALRSLVV